MKNQVRVRFAPSPTGFLHIGGLRTALYNWLFARHHGGVFVLRVEDTDRSRFVEGAMEKFYQSLAYLDLTPDEGYTPEGDRGDFGPYIQSERKDKHLAYANQLIEAGHAYYCFCAEEDLEEQKQAARNAKLPWMYNRRCCDLDQQESRQRVEAGEPHVIRLRVPRSGSIKMHDMIRGDIEIDWSQIDDQILVKTDGFPTYHLAAVCDDHDMEITHVIRGEEWISSLPKHIYLYECFGWDVPEFAHLPLLLNPDKTKLSKRQGDVDVEDYLKKGYLPEALINFVALLGWNPTADREIFDKEELAKLFEIGKVNKSGAVFNIEKLDWLNGEYIKGLDVKAYLKVAEPFIADLAGDKNEKRRAAEIFQDRVGVLSELTELVAELMRSVDYPADRLVWKKSTAEEAKARLVGLRDELANWKESDFASVEAIEKKVFACIEKNGWQNGDTLWPLRVALSGQEKSPSPFEYLFVLQQKESLARIDKAISLLA